MRLTNKLLKNLVLESLLTEVDVEQLGDVCFTGGSTHVMQTCTLDGEKFYLKFTEDFALEAGHDVSEQILVEYLAYKIYEMYSGVKIPKRIELVYDQKNQRVGIATSEIKGGKHALPSVNPRDLARMMSAGVYVDVFLANWDAVGTGSGNVMVAPGESGEQEAVRFDPGAAMSKRAQGGEKGGAWNERAAELQSMLKKGMGAGNVYQYADLSKAAQVLLGVSWGEIEGKINETCESVSAELEKRGMMKLLSWWEEACQNDKSILRVRHDNVSQHAKNVLQQ